MKTFKITQLLLLFAAATLSAAATIKNSEDGEKLRILSISPDKIRAVYHTSEEEGLDMTSEVTEQDSSVSITTLDGAELLFVQSSGTRSILWKILSYIVSSSSTTP